jgi:hypothetical protein
MHKFFYVLLIPLLASCISESTMFHGVDGTQTYSTDVRGSYRNDPDEHAAPLGYQLYRMQRKFSESEYYPEANRVQLDYTDDHLLGVNVYTDSTLLDNFVLKVKNKGDYLEIKRKLRLVPLPVLLWFHDEHRVILMKDPSGNLVVSHANFQAIQFLTMARSHNRHGLADYAPLKVE